MSFDGGAWGIGSLAFVGRPGMYRKSSGSRRRSLLYGCLADANASFLRIVGSEFEAPSHRPEALRPLAQPERAQESPVHALYLEFFDPLVGHVWKFVDSREDAVDIVHSLFVRLVEDDLWRDIEQPRAYLFRAARNAAWDYRKSGHRKLSTALEIESDETADWSDDNAMNAELAIINSEELSTLNEALGKLTIEERYIINLIYVEEMTLAAVAEKLGVSPRTIRTRKQNALSFLRGEIKRKGNRS